MIPILASAKNDPDPNGVLWVIAIGLVVVLIYGIAKSVQDAARKKEIYEKYGHTELAERIINKTMWVGETAEQLVDSLGRPVAIDDHVLKTKRKETWKYAQRGQNRFALRITVENGIVVGWDNKL
jgi:hypothetical protein